MVETVRCLILKEQKSNSDLWNECFQGLFLQKSPESKNPFALEFPGGKMWDNLWQRLVYFFKKTFCGSAYEEQIQQVLREVYEETGIKLAKKDVRFLGNYKYKNPKTKQNTVVHLFFVVLTKQVKLSVNKTLNEKGETEDKHMGAKWMNLKHFEKLLKNKEGDRKGSISKNTKGFKKLEKKLVREISKTHSELRMA